VLSGRGLCDELITRPEGSYRLWCVVCDLETSWMRRPWHTGGLLRQKQTKKSPDDGLQICPEHVEFYWRNKLRINSASSWFSLYGYNYRKNGYKFICSRK